MNICMMIGVILFWSVVCIFALAGLCFFILNMIDDIKNNDYSSFLISGSAVLIYIAIVCIGIGLYIK
jgi:hypothetical protein